MLKNRCFKFDVATRWYQQSNTSFFVYSESISVYKSRDSQFLLSDYLTAFASFTAPDSVLPPAH